MLNEKSENIEVLIKRPGEQSELTVIENSVKNFEGLIGGELDEAEITFFNVNMFFNKNQKAELKRNFNFCGVPVYGTAIFTGSSPRGEVQSLANADIPILKRIIKSNSLF